MCNLRRISSHNEKFMKRSFELYHIFCSVQMTLIWDGEHLVHIHVNWTYILVYVEKLVMKSEISRNISHKCEGQVWLPA